MTDAVAETLSLATTRYALDFSAKCGKSILAAETTVTRNLVADLDEARWHTPTPAAGWDIADQIGHLAYFDEAAVCSAVRPGEFHAALAEAQASGGIDPDDIAAQFRDRSGAQMLAWFDAARAELLTTFAGLDPRARLPWFGPAMSAASALTARLMETWAHTQDIADALGVRREPTGRLRHVAHIGVGARAFSYAVRGKTQPPVPVRVELTAPDGAVWTWGPAEAEDRVTGPALDFCLLVTQRRHRDDLSLAVQGPAATEWMSIAQAFAGAPGPGRPRPFSERTEQPILPAAGDMLVPHQAMFARSTTRRSRSS